MSPVHTRTVRSSPSGLVLGEDRVVWIGGPAQASSEIDALQLGDGEAVAFVALERGATGFGLAQVGVSGETPSNTEPLWLEYPNGMARAHVASAIVCNRPAVLYVRPSHAAPRSPQELYLSAVTERGLREQTRLAQAGVIGDLSIADSPGGALLAYTADGVTEARALRCVKNAKNN
jgi:hypothetical protein